MGIVEDLIQSLDLNQKDQKIKNVVVGIHWTMVTGMHSGLAATISDVSCCHASELAWTGHYHEKNSLELVNLMNSSDSLERSIGLAALNSLLEYDDDNVIEINAREVLFEKCTEKNVAIIGHFPFVDVLREKSKKFSVLELNPGPGDLPASEYVNILPEADVIGLTATTLINGTFDELHRCFSSYAYVVMMGPSTPMTSVMFDHGIDVLAGSRVTDPNVLSRFITQGTTLHKVDGLKRITITRK